MLAGVGISDLFSRVSGNAHSKLLILGSGSASLENLLNQLRSLNLEHVSPAKLLAQEISRRTPLGQKAENLARTGRSVPDDMTISLMRRWFWARKPDAGFVLTEFPATLLQALVLDEWLDARGEALDAVHPMETQPEDPTLVHYRTQGLLVQAAIPVSA